MKKIIFCYFHPSDNKNYIPLDIGYVVALLRSRFSHDFDIKIIPVSVFPEHKYPNVFLDKDILNIVESETDAIFFFLDNVQWYHIFALEKAKFLITKIRNKKSDIFIGLQSHKIQTEDVLQVLRNGLADCVIRKNPEKSFCEMNKILAKEDVDGVAYWGKETKNIRSYEGSNLRDDQTLDYLPSPYLAGIFDDFLQRRQVETSGNFRANLYFSRGCLFACYYCARSIKYDKKISSFSVARFYNEIEYLLEKFDIRNFFLLDDSFLSPHLERREFLQEFEKRKNKNSEIEKINLFVMIRPELLNEETIEFLKKINVCWVQVGLQTVNPALQKYINRRILLDKFKTITDMLHAGGIRFQIDVIMGLPDDTLEYFKKTLDCALALKPETILVRQLYLNPGTVFSEQSKEYEIKTVARSNGYFVPYVSGARGGVNEKYFKEANEYVEKKIEKFQQIKWKLATMKSDYMDGRWRLFL